MTRSPNRELAAWLLDAGRELPPVWLLRDANLAGYAYAVLPGSHPARAALRGDYLSALALHHRIKAELLPLVRAWNAAGLEPLLFKGFYLAEFVYPAPGMRYHGDVDVLFPAAEAESAREVALGSGWQERYNTAQAGYPYHHGVCSLHGPGGATCIDLHRWVLHSAVPFNRVQQSVSAAVWAQAETRSWEGTRVRVAAPVDALLVGLVLQRCWGGDRWQLKPHDALDCRLLAQGLGVTAAALRERARELHAQRTLALFLERCDPAAGRLELTPPTGRDVRRWNRAVVAERGGLLATYGPTLARLSRAPRALGRVLVALPSLLAARRALRRHRDIQALLRSLEPPGAREPGSLEERDMSLVALLRGARLFPRNRAGDCLLRSLALCHLLWRKGWPARFVSGVRREEGGVCGHAWVELDGKVLAVLNEPRCRQRYTVSLEYPPAPARDEARALQEAWSEQT